MENLESLEILTIEELHRLNKKLIDVEVIDSLFLNPNVKNLEELGDGYVDGREANIISVELIDKSSFIVYYSRYSCNGC